MGVNGKINKDVLGTTEVFPMDFEENMAEWDNLPSKLGEDRFAQSHQIQMNPEKVVSLLRTGGVIITPTDTLYGMAARIHDERAVKRLFQLKGRSLEKQIPVLVENPEKMVPELVSELSPLAEKLIERFWPGPLTLVLPAKKGLPKGITGNAQAVGIRQAGNPVTRALIEALGEPITGTSANVMGAPSPIRLQQISKNLLEQVDFVIDGGGLSGQKGSTVLDLTSKEIKILRQGDLPLYRIREVIDF